MSALAAENQDVRADVKQLENRVTSIETRLAVAERDIEGINKKLDKIDANLSKLMWIVIVAVVGAVLRIVMQGA